MTNVLPSEVITLLQEEFGLSGQEQVADFLELTQGRVSQIKSQSSLSKRTLHTILRAAFNAGKKKERETIREKHNTNILDAYKTMHGLTTQGDLAASLGINPNLLAQWKNGYAPIPLASVQKILKNASPLKIAPIVEMKEVDPGKPGGKWYFFHEKTNGKREALIKKLEKRKGIYIYLDSCGRPTYVGKADRTPLDREVENRLSQGTKKGRIVYGESLKKSPSLLQGEITKYISVYDVSPPEAIPLVEALLIRSNGNVLYNKRLEGFSQKSGKKAISVKKRSSVGK